MSKNPAWNAYNEAVRAINSEYEVSVQPLRKQVSVEIAKTEKKYDEKINPLVMEKAKIIGEIKIQYTEKVMEAEQARQKATKTAHDVLQAELKAGKDRERERSAAV